DVERAQAVYLDYGQLEAEAFYLALGDAVRALARVAVLDVFELLRQPLFSGDEDGLLPLPALVALLEVGAVVAAVDLQPGAVHLPDSIHDMFVEVAVVADRQQAAFPLA